ncbi:50S ribosome-binding GTPase [Microbispora sp. RL4-1S]|uniref:50S ribosome-binding GTPase n=1 Tax=Microbispora oryzae TaxID=2806554 RepID=A0A940WRB2_9ACTN|nr:GTPase [Microbispora oryzae]MBP2705564.1 50S ribosome-binding GTPase [Microbispora oryzae]
MKLLGGRAEAPLDDRLTALAEAAELAEGRAGRADVEHARAVVERAGARCGLSVDHTAAALAGATGSGKSSLFNALAGADLAVVGVTRPTTAKAQAAIWGPDGAGPLLDWLDVPVRHVVGGETPRGVKQLEATGLILLDLPDHDSIELSHRLEVDRLVGVVDLLVWVLDPQKYADAAVHERYLRPLARHRDVMVVVLNQVDRLPAGSVARCLDDLRGLLAADGLAGVPVVGVSARTGRGVAELGLILERRVSQRRAWAVRLAADVATAADALRPDAPVADAPRSGERAAAVSPERLNRPPDRPLVRALEQAAAVPLVVEAVAKAHRHRAVAATGWPVTRWLRRLRPDPLRRLHLGRRDARTSLPAATAVQVSAVDTALRDVGDAAAREVPEPWATAVRHAARSRAGELADALDRTVATTSAGMARPPRWWRAAGTLQWLTVGAMAIGALWLLLLFATDYLLLTRPPTPTVGRVPWPTVLLAGGALAGVVVALLCRVAAWIGGRRRARRAARRLRAGVERVARDLVIAPVNDELSRYAQFARCLTVAASGRAAPPRGG